MVPLSQQPAGSRLLPKDRHSLCQVPAGPCAQAVPVLSLASLNCRVGLWKKNVPTVSETAGVFQSFLTCISRLCACFSSLLWNLTALVVAQMFLKQVWKLVFNGDW